MRLDQDQNLTSYQIKQVEPGRLQINETWYEQSLIITPQQLQLWPPRTLKELTAEHLQPLIALQPKILLLGTGHSLIFPESDLLTPFAKHHIGVEIMATKAACRTYEALMAEERHAIAALLIE